MIKTFLETHGPAILNALGSILLSLLGLASYRVSTWIKAHTRNLRVQGMLLRLDDAVFNAVEAVEQVTVASLVASAKDGRLSSNGAAIAKEAALSTIKQHLGPQGIAELQAILGVHPDSLDSFLGTRVEARVLKMPETVASKPEAKS